MFRLWVRKYAIINSNLCFNFVFDWSIPPTWLYVSTLSSKICYNQLQSMLQLCFWLKYSTDLALCFDSEFENMLSSTRILTEVFHRLGFMFRLWVRKYAIINSNLCFNFSFDWSIPPTWLYVSTLSSKICYNQLESMLQLCFWLKYSTDLALCFDSEFENMLWSTGIYASTFFDWSIPPTCLYVSTLSSKICYNQLESMLQLCFWLKYSTDLALCFDSEFEIML